MQLRDDERDLGSSSSPGIRASSAVKHIARMSWAALPAPAAEPSRGRTPSPVHFQAEPILVISVCSDRGQSFQIPLTFRSQAPNCHLKALNPPTPKVTPALPRRAQPLLPNTFTHSTHDASRTLIPLETFKKHFTNFLQYKNCSESGNRQRQEPETPPGRQHAAQQSLR